MVKTFLISFYVNGKLMAQYNYGSCRALKSFWNIFGGQFFATISWFYRPSTAPKCAILYTSTVLPTPDKLTFSALGGTGGKWMNREWDQFLLYWIYMKDVLFIIYVHQDMRWYLFENKLFFHCSIQWRHNESDGVSITSLTIIYSTVYSGAHQRKHQSSASLAFVRGIHRWPVNSPHKGPVPRKMFPFDDGIMCSCNI